VAKPVPTGRPDVASVIKAMLRAREVAASPSWSTSQEPTSENWWADARHLREFISQRQSQLEFQSIVHVLSRLTHAITDYEPSANQAETRRGTASRDGA
jgi:hypothetical protein